MVTPRPELVDRGFDADFGMARIQTLCELFTSERTLQSAVYDIHREDNTLDMKRGEFYPEILRSIASLKRAAASAYALEPAQVHPNFGSNGSIDTIMAAMKLREVNRGTNMAGMGGMLVSTPTYFRNYNSCASKQMRMVPVPLRADDWTCDGNVFVETMKRARPTVVFLVTPNNPTGIAIKDEVIIDIIENAPDDCLVVMDRTLVNIRAEIDSRELLRRFRHKQLAIMHSLSKYAGLSHLRVGIALYSRVELAEEVRPHLPLGLGVEGAVRATKLLVEGGILQPTTEVVGNIEASKTILTDFCQHSRLFSCTDFVGNYCLVCLDESLRADTVTRLLEERGIYVMGGHEFPEPLPSVLRLHTGGKAEFMGRTVEALEDIERYA